MVIAQHSAIGMSRVWRKLLDVWFFKLSLENRFDLREASAEAHGVNPEHLGAVPRKTQSTSIALL